MKIRSFVVDFLLIPAIITLAVVEFVTGVRFIKEPKADTFQEEDEAWPRGL